MLKRGLRCFFIVFMTLLYCNSYSQEMTLLEQFNGRFDFTFVGKTLNTGPNNDPNVPCEILTESSENLNLAPGETIEKAYLYWAGSGNGDFEVKLNGVDITPDQTFNLVQSSSGFIFFGAMKDVTAQVAATGNGTYTLSELDLTDVIPLYCTNATNFAGWALIIIYQNNSLPLNQINVYSGFDYVAGGHTTVEFELSSLNVIDEVGAKIGVLAWEGDPGLASNETLQINDQKLFNALNPITNVFNSTNSVTNSTESHNMDLDIFDIENNIHPGDSSATVKLTSSADFVMINAVITKLNSQLPDATILVENLRQECDSRRIKVDFTVSNLNSTDELEAAVPIGIYANDTYIEYAETLLPIPIGGSQHSTISLEIPDEIPNDFVLRFVVDSNQSGVGTIKETNENNNVFLMDISLWTSPKFNKIPDLTTCDVGFGKGIFNLSESESLIKVDPNDAVKFYQNLQDAEAELNPISAISDYELEMSPEEIFVRLENEHCFSITSLNLITKKCQPIVYNLLEPSSNSFYDTLEIKGLRDIFMHFHLSIYNRWGNLVWTGNNATPDWNGKSNQGKRVMGDELTEGTYYYILELNDPEFPNPLSGFIYLKR